MVSVWPLSTIILFDLGTVPTVCCFFCFPLYYHKGNNKITELRTILQRESQNLIII